MPAHRSQRRRAYVETERHDELSDGVPADPAELEAASRERKAGGSRIAPGTSAVQRLGGKALKGRTKLTHEVGPIPVEAAAKARARYARKRLCTELAETVGGGRCGMVPSFLAKLSMEDAALRESALTAGNIDLARKLGESSRSHLLYAREAAAKDAQARRAKVQANPHAGLLAALDDEELT